MRTLVLVPVLGRPERAAPVAESLRRASPGVDLLFLCSPGDDVEIAACRRAGRLTVVRWPAGRGDYARKMNLGFVQAASEGYEWVFLGADDLRFHRGWLEACYRRHVVTGACVIGTNDLGNPRVIAGRHSTHTLVHVDYLECGTIDEDGKILHEGYDHNYCNPPEAPIWMGDCSFKALGDVAVGDVVVGWERVEREGTPVGAPRRCLAYSEVLGVRRRKAPLVRVVMASGREFRCTADHRWLNANWSPSAPRAAQWVTPRIGRTLLHVADEPDPVPPEQERLAGWLAGIYDGEGSGIVIAAQSCEHNPDVVAAIDDALQALGVDHRMSVRRSGIAEFVLNGGHQGYLDFLLRIAPVRAESLRAHVLGYRPRASSRTDREPIGARRFGRSDRIVAVESAGSSSEVVALTTSTGNYVAWGYASRNCDDEFVQTAQVRRTFAAAPDAIIEHLHPIWGKATDDATYRKGQAHFDEDRVLYERRQHLWLSWRGRRY